MGTFTKKIGSGNVYDYWLYWDQNSQNVTNNTSNVTVKLYVKRNDGYASSSWRNYNDCTISLTVAGIRRYYTTTANVDTRNSKTVELASWTGDLSHNADGTFTMSMDGSFTFPGSTSLGGTWTISTSAPLTTIPRATTPTLSNSSVDMGDTVTINLPSASSSFTHKVWYRPSGGSWAVIVDGATTSCTWTVPDLGGYIPNSTNLQVEIDVETFNGSTKIGEKSVWMTATIPASYIPSISSVLISEATSGIAAKFGAFVQNKSKLAVAITASGSHGSTISRYETYIQAVAYREASFTSNIITASGTIGVVTTVTDSRGRTANVSNSATILEYAPPKINSLSAWRIDTSGNTSDEGSRIAMAMNFAISPIGGKNDRTYNLKYRKSTDADFTSFGNGTASWEYNDTQYFTDAPEISPDYAYIVRLEVADYFQTIAYDVQIPTAFTLMDFRSTGKGIAIGKVSEKDEFEVALPADFSSSASVASTFRPFGGCYVHSADGVYGETGYVKFAEIRIKQSYVDMAFSIKVYQRKQIIPTTLFIQFSGENNVDPGLTKFQAIGTHTEYWIKKESASIWGLYAQKNEEYDNVDVVAFDYPTYLQTGLSVSWTNNLVNSIDGATKCAVPTVDLRLANVFGQGDGESGYIVLNGYGICWGYIQLTVPITNAWGSMYYGRTNTEINYPLGFASSPSISLTCEQISGNVTGVTAASTNASGISGLYFYAPDSRTTDVWLHWCARGKLSGW